MRRMDGKAVGRAVARMARRAAACALAMLPLALLAAPPAGTVITNQASATAQTGSGALASSSNTVNFSVAATGTAAAVLAASQQVNSQPGATVTLGHTLTNNGTVADTFTVSLTPLNPSGWSFTSVAAFADANGDGVPDSNTPLGATTLAPGQTLRFVVRFVIPASAPLATENSVRIGATSTGNAAVAPIGDRILLPDTSVPLDCGIVTKSLSRDRGPSPAGPVTVTLFYSSCDKARGKVVLFDLLPAGFRYVANSGRWSGSGGLVLTDGVAADDRQGGGSTQVAYDWNVSRAGAVTATVFNLPANTGGSVSFDVQVDGGLATGTRIDNTAGFTFYDTSNVYQGMRYTAPASYTVNGRADFELAGDRLATVAPGTTAVFTNVLTNRGDTADTYDITLAGSTFPAGTTLQLFKADGVTPLADTDGDGVPDTGIVAPGASYRIVLRAFIPATAPAGTYRVTKVGRSAASAMNTAQADDVVDAVTSKCALTFEPDNTAQVAFGQHVTYTHFLANRGNCVETVQAMPNYVADSRPGWTSKVYLDNPNSGGASLPGALDPTDTLVTQGWTTTLAPGATLRVLVDVQAPTMEAFTALTGKAANAKALTDSDVTTAVLTSNGSGALTVRDTTNVLEQSGPANAQNVIRNFTDGTYGAPTVWAIAGGELWLKADAASCNARRDQVETRVVVITGPNGEREQSVATETGPDTGIFLVPALPLRAPPVHANDGILQGNAGDVFEIQLLGCDRSIDTLVTVMDARSVVFDSLTNAGIPGATVTLVPATGGQCGTAPANVPGGGNPVVTGADGRFGFRAVASGAYCLRVQPPNGYRAPSTVEWPRLPAGHNLVVSGLASGGSYGGAFGVGGSGLVVADIPVDAIGQAGLFVQKEASRASVEVGEFVDYVVRVRNATGNALDRADVTLADDLPPGFGFVAGTARRDRAAIANPAGGAGPHLVFRLGSLASGAEAVISYRVRVGPGALQGDGVNRVQARYAAAAETLSNVASAKVVVTGGVFTEKGFVLGKVFLDCNANGLQDARELGVPGIRVLLEDGTYAITDGGGKFSFYGISNRSHVVKVDRATLPPGASLAATSFRHLGDGGSRLVDLKAGELARADFAIAGCASALVDDVKARIDASGATDELAAMLASQLTTEARVLSDVKALPATGLVQAGAATTGVGSAGLGALPITNPASTTTPAVPFFTDRQPSPAPRLPAPTGRAREEQQPLESVLPAMDKALAFINLYDGQVLEFAQATVRVKGTSGATFTLTVNGAEVPASRVGKRSVLAEKQLQGWEYIGIELQPGENVLAVSQVDGFGNARGSVSIKVYAPGALAKVLLSLPQGGGIADGKTPARIAVKLVDAKGTPVTVRTPVTLDATLGRWKTEDLDPAQPGLQVMVEGGRLDVELLPPLEPGAATLTATSGTAKTVVRLDFLPELRSLVATGVVEGIVNMRNAGSHVVTPVRASDAFEQELTHLSREWNDGKTKAGTRAAFYLKGKVLGEYLLTAAYDSDKDTKERLFRDIQPDEFYPVYGDSAVRGFDAQSTSRLYVRVDRNRSYLLWGDFTTQVASDARKLSNYSRSLTGVKEHYQNDRVSVNAFASRDSTRQVIEELRANGTSGPYQMSTPNPLVNSEKVEILVRDRNQPALVLSTTPQARFADYEVEALTGRILFKSPVSSVDRDLNPVFVRITYEVDQGGEQFWVAGIDAQVKVTDRIEVGGVYVRDQNPLAPFRMAGANATVKVAEGTYVTGEAARTESGLEGAKGDAGRLEIKHESANLKANGYFARTDKEFNNPGAYLNQGRGEAGGKLEYRLSDKTVLKAEALRTEDVASGSVREGLAWSIQHHWRDYLTVELGMRHAADKGPGSAVPVIQAPDGQGIATDKLPDEVTTVRAKATVTVPQVQGLSVYGEAEVDVRDADRKVVAAGAEYQLPNKGRVYARHEFISSLAGPYGLNATERQNTTAVGVDTEYMKDGKVFSEYRIRDAISGGDTEAALGLKNLWSIAPGWRLGTSLERVQVLAGSAQAENNAVALALEYTGSPVLKGSTRLEVRNSHTTESLLFTVGLAARLSRDWTLLARNAYTGERIKETGGEHVVDRMQAGVAFRDNETNRWNALARIEHRVERNDEAAGVDLKTATTILSLHADWQLARPFLVSGRYAAKWSRDDSNGLSTKYRAQVVGARGTWEFAPRWDVSLVSSALFGESANSRQYGVGLEVGYLLATNLWVSAGYNFTGYRDADMAGADYTARGPFVRLRYKFDESVLDGMPAKGAARENDKTVTTAGGEGGK